MFQWIASVLTADGDCATPAGLCDCMRDKGSSGHKRAASGHDSNSGSERPSGATALSALSLHAHPMRRPRVTVGHSTTQRERGTTGRRDGDVGEGQEHTDEQLTCSTHNTLESTTWKRPLRKARSIVGDGRREDTGKKDPFVLEYIKLLTSCNCCDVSRIVHTEQKHSAVMGASDAIFDDSCWYRAFSAQIILYVSYHSYRAVRSRGQKRAGSLRGHTAQARPRVVGDPAERRIEQRQHRQAATHTPRSLSDPLRACPLSAAASFLSSPLLSSPPTDSAAMDVYDEKSASFQESKRLFASFLQDQVRPHERGASNDRRARAAAEPRLIACCSALSVALRCALLSPVKAMCTLHAWRACCEQERSEQTTETTRTQRSKRQRAQPQRRTLNRLP